MPPTPAREFEDAAAALAWIRERGTIENRGMTYDIGRQGFVNPLFYMRAGGRTLVEARKPRWYRRRFEVEVGPRSYELVATSWLRRSFSLRFEGAVVGTIAPRGIFTRRIRIDLPDELPVELPDGREVVVSVPLGLGPGADFIALIPSGLL